MKKPIAIIAGEPNSISSEIIFKSWKYKNSYKHKPFFIVGSFEILKSQMKKLKYNIKIKKINKNFKKKDFMDNELPIYDIKYYQKKSFEKISSKSNKYIFKCFDLASELANKKKFLELLIALYRKNFCLKKNIKVLLNIYLKKRIKKIMV